MVVNRANATDLANIAREIGAEVIEGTVAYPSDTGGWLIGDLDFCEHLDTYRDRKVMVLLPRTRKGRIMYSGGRGKQPGLCRTKCVSAFKVGAMKAIVFAFSLSAILVGIVVLLFTATPLAFAQAGPNMDFLADVTIPDGTVIGAGEVFTKTWKLENTGGVDWLGYSLQFISGDEMNGEPDNVAPVKTNGIADLTVIFTAPKADGTYSSVWSLVDEKGNRVGSPFLVRIRVGRGVLEDDPALAARIAELAEPFVASMNESFRLGDIEFRVVNVYRNDAIGGPACRPCTVEDKVWAVVRFNVTNHTGQSTKIADHVLISMMDFSPTVFGDSYTAGSIARTALLAAPVMFGGEVGTIWSNMGTGYVDAAMIHVEPVPASAIGLQAVFVDSVTEDWIVVHLQPMVSKSEMRYEGEFINAPARE